MPELTTVISVRGQERAKLLADPNFVYVGRAVPRSGWTASIWANPFRVTSARWGDQIRPNDVSDAGTAVERFERYLLANPELMARLPELRGKTLACWCGCWRPGEPEIRCHAVVLAKLANAI